jgi:NTE family protein
MSVQFRNLVFEGGGVKSIAYIGAMQVMGQRGALQGIGRVGGTSAGAINALLFALGYTVREQLDLLSSMDFKAFMDDSFGVIRDIRRLATKYGWHDGGFFSSWIGEIIKEKLGNARATFSDLRSAGKPDLYVTGTNLCTGYSEVFSAERHSDMPLTQAVRISMSIPLFFAAVRFGPRKDVYVDGGVMVNYPVKLFDRERYIDMADEPTAARRTEYYNRENASFLLSNPGRSPYVYNRQTLGMRLDTKEEIGLFRYNEPIQGKPIRKFQEYARALIGAVMNAQENQHLHGDDWQRTLYIDTLDVGTTDFDLSDKQKETLVRQGIKGAETYFQWFENPRERPVNRIDAEEVC